MVTSKSPPVVFRPAVEDIFNLFYNTINIFHIFDIYINKKTYLLCWLNIRCCFRIESFKMFCTKFVFFPSEHCCFMMWDSSNWKCSQFLIGNFKIVFPEDLQKDEKVKKTLKSQVVAFFVSLSIWQQLWWKSRRAIWPDYTFLTEILKILTVRQSLQSVVWNNPTSELREKYCCVLPVELRESCLVFILTSLMFTYISSIWNCNKIYKLQQPQPQLNLRWKKNVFLLGASILSVF